MSEKNIETKGKKTKKTKNPIPEIEHEMMADRKAFKETKKALKKITERTEKSLGDLGKTLSRATGGAGDVKDDDDAWLHRAPTFDDGIDLIIEANDRIKSTHDDELQFVFKDEDDMRTLLAKTIYLQNFIIRELVEKYETAERVISELVTTVNMLKDGEEPIGPINPFTGEYDCDLRSARMAEGIEQNKEATQQLIDFGKALSGEGVQNSALRVFTEAKVAQKAAEDKKNSDLEKRVANLEKRLEILERNLNQEAAPVEINDEDEEFMSLSDMLGDLDREDSGKTEIIFNNCHFGTAIIGSDTGAGDMYGTNSENAACCVCEDEEEEGDPT